VFANHIRNWHGLPSANKTWPRFKTHFKEAQRAIIRSLPAVTADSLGHHDQANVASVASVVDQVINQLQAQQNADSALTPGSAAEALAEQQMNMQLANMANATQQSQTMFEQMQSLQSAIATLQNQVNNNRNNPGGGGGGGQGGGN
jgi:excinuclease UvrABC ATPase subunit